MGPLDDLVYCRCGSRIIPWINEPKDRDSLRILCELCYLDTDYCRWKPIVLNETIDR
jgi:hypothetical protein